MANVDIGKEKHTNKKIYQIKIYRKTENFSSVILHLPLTLRKAESFLLDYS